MNVLAINGSPRKKWNTATLLAKSLEGAASHAELEQAWVRLRPGAEPMSVEGLREFCAGKLAHYKVPRKIEFVTSFPLSPSGKILRRKLREMEKEHQASA